MRPHGAAIPRSPAMDSVLGVLIYDWTRVRSGEECEQLSMAAGVRCSRYRSVREANERRTAGAGDPSATFDSNQSRPSLRPAQSVTCGHSGGVA